MNIDEEMFDAYKCPTPERAMRATILVSVAMVEALRKDEAAFAALRDAYYRAADIGAPDGTRARLFANMIWNGAEEKARRTKAIYRCRACHQKNRGLLAKRGVCGSCKQPLYPQDIVEVS